MSTLQSGQTGAAVSQLQGNLNILGYGLLVTGVYDVPTYNAVFDFQTKYLRGSGYKATGVFDAQTASMLAAAIQAEESGGLGGGSQPQITATATGPRYGTVNIPSGAGQVAVSFSPPYPTVPYIPQGTVLKASADDDNISVVSVLNLTAQGCVFILSSLTSNPNYQLGFHTNI